MIDKNDIDRISSLPIEQVADALGMKVVRHQALCPFHNDSHPSLRFNIRTNRFRCFVCEHHGGPIDLTMHMLNMNFRDAVCWLAQTFQITINEEYRPFDNVRPRIIQPVSKVKAYPPDIEYLNTLFRHPVLNDEAQRFLFDQRRLDPRVIRWCGISSISVPTPCWRYGRPYYDAPSLLIPYRDINGNLLSVQSRYLGSEIPNPETSKPRNPEVPRFRFPPNGSVHIYNLPILRYLKPHEPLFISEGVTDCLALMSAGHKAIAIPSATLLKPQDMNTLSTLTSQLSTPFHIYPDNDGPGEQLYNHLQEIITKPSLLVRHQLPSGCKDFSEYYIQYLLPDTGNKNDNENENSLERINSKTYKLTNLQTQKIS